MRRQIIIIKGGVTDGSYQYKGLWSQFAENNLMKRVQFSLYPLEDNPNLQIKDKGSLQFKDKNQNKYIF